MNHCEVAMTTVQKYLEDGDNIFPFSDGSSTQYIKDLEDFRPALRLFGANQAIVIENSSKAGIESFESLKKWARSTLLKVLAHATSVSDPSLSDYNIWQFIDNNIAPILNNDNSPVHVGVSLWNRPIIALCMSPIYPIHHSRYAPNTILVLVWLNDIEETVALHKIRDAMLRDNSSIYDAIELILPLPTITLAN